MENKTDDSIFYQSVQKSVSLTVAYLIGTKMDILTDNNPGHEELFEKLQKNTDAVIFRALCNIRSNLMLTYTSTERNIVFNMQNLDRIELFRDDVKTLARQEIYVVKANCRVNRYITEINQLISQKLPSVKDLFRSG